MYGERMSNELRHSPLPQGGRLLVSVLGGLAVGGLFVFVAGILSIQIEGLMDGAILSLNNSVIGVTEPRTPFLQMTALAALSGLAMLLLTYPAQRRSNRSRISFASGFLASSIALVVSSFFLTTTQVPGARLFLGVPSWRGWLLQAGVTSAVHAVLLVAVGTIIYSTMKRKNATGHELSQASE